MDPQHLYCDERTGAVVAGHNEPSRAHHHARDDLPQRLLPPHLLLSCHRDESAPHPRPERLLHLLQ